MTHLIMADGIMIMADGIWMMTLSAMMHLADIIADIESGIGSCHGGASYHHLGALRRVLADVGQELRRPRRRPTAVRLGVDALNDRRRPEGHHLACSTPTTAQSQHKLNDSKQC